MQSELIQEIESFTKKFGLAETSIGSLAVKDSRFVGRLRANGGISLRNAERVRAWMRIEAARRLDPPVYLEPNDFFDIPAAGDPQGHNAHASAEGGV